MSRINKVLCDKCKKELKETDYLKFSISSTTRTENGYIKNVPMGRMDLCQDCFKKLGEFLERN